MDLRRLALLGCAAILTAAMPATWGAPPPGAELREATIALGYEAGGRCPDLTQADAEDGAAALVILVVGPSGVPSQPSIKSSSGSQSLDAAAISCVMKLRFLPAVRAGEGSPMASWQEIAWKWGRGGATHSAAAQGSAAAHPAPGGAEVRVCADEAGRLTQDPVITRSSGDPGLDEAARRIARSGAPYYRPAAAASVTGCVQLAIKFEAQ